MKPSSGFPKSSVNMLQTFILINIYLVLYIFVFVHLFQCITFHFDTHGTYNSFFVFTFPLCFFSSVVDRWWEAEESL